MTMEPNNNLEKQFREKLNSREIKPSENAWDRLDAMLTVAEKPKQNFSWIYFAASFLGFFLIATVFFSKTEEVIDSEHQKVVLEQNDIENTTIDLEKLGVSIPVKASLEVVAASKKDTTKQKIDVKPKTILVNEEKLQTEVAVISNIKPNSLPIIDQKMEVKVDANSLLASVENNQSSKPSNDAVALSVNTAELLSQVDGELELSFREKVIKSVNKTYKEVKVAVIKRNLE